MKISKPFFGQSRQSVNVSFIFSIQEGSHSVVRGIPLAHDNFYGVEVKSAQIN